MDWTTAGSCTHTRLPEHSGDLQEPTFEAIHEFLRNGLDINSANG